MRKTGFIYSPVYLKHNTGNHPENLNRLIAILRCVEKEKLKGTLINISPLRANVEQISWIHTKEYINSIEQACKTCSEQDSPHYRMNLDADTVISGDSYNVALFAAGGVIAGVDAVFKGKVDNVFCAVRPPGHHAEKDRAMGFCIFNNIAIGAAYAQKIYKINKIFIVDWDLHHGNGTQHTFYNDPAVFYTSIHQQNIFPGTGIPDEIGEGEGRGFTMNLPLPAGQGDKEYISIFRERICPQIIHYRPDLIMLSAGFDTHRNDPLGSMKVTSEGFGKLTDIICSLADKTCQGRIVSVLEGGYDLEALGESVVFHLKCLIGEKL